MGTAGHAPGGSSGHLQEQAYGLGTWFVHGQLYRYVVSRQRVAAESMRMDSAQLDHAAQHSFGSYVWAVQSISCGRQGPMLTRRTCCLLGTA
jgi:hypothetical protein